MFSNEARVGKMKVFYIVKLNIIMVLKLKKVFQKFFQLLSFLFP